MEKRIDMRQQGELTKFVHEKILVVVDDDPDIRTIVKDRLQRTGYQVITAEDGEEALKIIAQEEPDAVILDLQMPRMNGMEVIKRLKDNSYPPIIVITAYGTIEKAVSAMKEGAYDFITKPFSPDHLEAVIKKAIEHRELKQDNCYLQSVINASFPGIIGESQKIREAMSVAQKVAPTSSTVLLLGESGTGKEIFARFIHRWSQRSKKPFVVINSVAIRDELLESELFGHEKGAFTGAYQMKRGKLEVGNGGTVFLDEIGDLKVELQTKLLRFLEEREFERVGGVSPIHIDVRIIAATNQDLFKRVQEGRFRSDLFFRLNVVSIHLPPLRERREDIPPLTHFFLEHACCESNKSLLKVSKEAMDHLMNYHWPGNARELKNLMERAVVLAEGDKIMPHDLPLSNFQKLKEDIQAKSYHDATLYHQREVIRRALERSGGNQSRAAESLHLQRTYLARLIKKLNIREASGGVS